MLHTNLAISCYHIIYRCVFFKKRSESGDLTTEMTTFGLVGLVGPGHLQALNHIQVFGASLTILGGVLYGKSRQWIEQEAEDANAKGNTMGDKGAKGVDTMVVNGG